MNSVYKYIIFYPEPDESQSMCVVMSLLTLLFMDDIFEHIHSPTELFHPEHLPLHAYSVPIKTKWLGMSVFQWAQLDLVTRQWVTHSREAISYSKYHSWLAHFSLIHGFQHKFINTVTVDVQSLQCGQEEGRSLLQVGTCPKHIKSYLQLTSPFPVRG